MKRNIIYTITNEEAEKVIDSWHIADTYAQKWLCNLLEKLSILEKALSDRKPLDDLTIAYIDDEIFNITRAAISPYTTKLKRLISQLEADPDNMPISKRNYNLLKEIHLSADTWYKSYNHEVQRYKSVMQIYEIKYLNHYGVIDIS
jgi:hypothetical protein